MFKDYTSAKGMAGSIGELSRHQSEINLGEMKRVAPEEGLAYLRRKGKSVFNEGDEHAAVEHLERLCGGRFSIELSGVVATAERFYCAVANYPGNHNSFGSLHADGLTASHFTPGMTSGPLHQTLFANPATQGRRDANGGMIMSGLGGYVEELEAGTVVDSEGREVSRNAVHITVVPVRVNGVIKFAMSGISATQVDLVDLMRSRGGVVVATVRTHPEAMLNAGEVLIDPNDITFAIADSSATPAHNSGPLTELDLAAGSHLVDLMERLGLTENVMLGLGIGPRASAVMRALIGRFNGSQEKHLEGSRFGSIHYYSEMGPDEIYEAMQVGLLAQKVYLTFMSHGIDVLRAFNENPNVFLRRSSRVNTPANFVTTMHELGAIGAVYAVSSLTGDLCMQTSCTTGIGPNGERRLINGIGGNTNLQEGAMAVRNAGYPAIAAVIIKGYSIAKSGEIRINFCERIPDGVRITGTRETASHWVLDGGVIDLSTRAFRDDFESANPLQLEPIERPWLSNPTAGIPARF